MIEDYSLEKRNAYNITVLSGGAIGSDTIFESVALSYGYTVKAFSYKTSYHNSSNKVEISDKQYLEGIEHVKRANKTLKRKNISKYYPLLSRNYFQIKDTKQVFAIGTLKDFKIVNGGTGYAVQMAIDNYKPVYVFEQDLNSWFEYSYNQKRFIKCSPPYITKDIITGIGTREINENGILAIRDLFNRIELSSSFENKLF